MEAYIDLMAKRGHVEYAQQVIETNKSGKKELPKNWISGFEKGSDPFPVIKATLPEIGILGGLSGDVARFYSQATAVRLTLMAVGEGAYDDARPVDLAHIFEEELALWLDTESHARTTIRVLRTV